ncbi:FecR family protein [Oceanospirillum linum]|uniref:FecR protein domain-containing protein n=1 Tax=Oceanospirillum linum TaxID=966 RepID=A0A1T1HFV2_OCELI|nr:FecR family protein [Oceanospirillum linum]OOV88695.1 hypothetical protein BTA35_0204240 [Oceanospirillum linum]SEG02478.1 FecR protein [Oleiphilus messinensis]SMP21569.1 FecR family protein [Oceanospirillum linum]
MHSLKYLSLILLVCCCFDPVAYAEDDSQPMVGNIIQIQGRVQLFRSGKIEQLKEHTILQEGDRVITASSGRVGLRMRDNSRILLANTTEFEIKRYRFDPVAGTSDAQFKLVTGAFRAITGAIGQQSDPQFEVETPVATIGIRGTDFWGGFIFNGDLDVAMFRGKGVYIRNALGMTEITQKGYGVTVQERIAPPAAKPWPDRKLRQAMESTRL